MKTKKEMKKILDEKYGKNYRYQWNYHGANEYSVDVFLKPVKPEETTKHVGSYAY